LTGAGVVDMIFTDLCVMDVTENGLVLLEQAPGVSVEEIEGKTAARFSVSPDLKEIPCV
jgi:3-oxoacid CoA-transferase subunit B